MRPSPDRVRETVFNWLAPHIEGARCLDLFAGSGALGLEALSRGAAWVDFVDTDRRLLAAVDAHLEALGCRNAATISDDAARYLDRVERPYDIVFLDPPFDQGLLPEILGRLTSSEILSDGARVYLERNAKTDIELPAGWSMWRDSRAGQVRYGIAVALA